MGKCNYSPNRGIPAPNFVLAGSITTDGVCSKTMTAAVKWYRRAAERGDEMSQYNMAAIYAYGRGVHRAN